MLRDEQWRQIGDTRYYVSDKGQVFGPAGIILKPQVDMHGYLRVKVGSTPRKLHRLVAEAFVPGTGELVRHLDGDQRNNAASNLAWGTKSENEQDKVRHGTHQQAAKTHCVHGHPYDEINTYVTPAGYRDCRACRAERRRAYKARIRG